jgi:predicted GNAT superfamily acetyltransferase
VRNSPTGTSTGDPAATAAVAAADAAAAAQKAGVHIRLLETLDELDSANHLYNSIWRSDPSNPLVTRELLRAMAKAGSYVAGAYEGSELVGASFGFFSSPGARSLHSHIAGVSARMQGRNIGYCLKLHQRAWALSQGVSTISWTFDPLVSRNAHFNVTKLRAEPTEYLTNFYGPMMDEINVDNDSDRLLVRWDLLASPVVEACGRLGCYTPTVSGDDRRPRTAGLSVSAGMRPTPGRLDAAIVTLAVPRDIEQMRSSDPALAAAWRIALRATLRPLMAAGARVTAFDARSGYSVTREENS